MAIVAIVGQIVYK